MAVVLFTRHKRASPCALKSVKDKAINVHGLKRRLHINKCLLLAEV